jgi:hypothetical protein
MKFSERDFKTDYNEIAAYSIVDGHSDQITNDVRIPGD